MIYQILAGLSCLLIFLYAPNTLRQTQQELEIRRDDVPAITQPILLKTYCQTDVITVFIHGSLHVPSALLSPLTVMFDSFDGTSWYERMNAQLREHPGTQQGGIVLDQGLIEITDLIKQPSLPQEFNQRAAYHVIRCFNLFTPRAPRIQRRYFTFGWSGILSEREREAAAANLYDALLQIKNMVHKQGRAIRIELYAFSHGGQLALLLPYVRAKRGNEDFLIDLVVLSAVPLYPKNTLHIATGMFSTVINCYSPGDFAQTIDFFSTPRGRCFQTLAETIPSLHRDFKSRLIDLAITIDNAYPIPHRAFFDIDQLAFAPRRFRRSESYRSRYKAAELFVTGLNPLPLLAIYPMLLIPFISATDNATLAAAPYNRVSLGIRGIGSVIHATYNEPATQRCYEMSWLPGDNLQQARDELRQVLIARPKRGRLMLIKDHFFKKLQPALGIQGSTA